MYPMVTIGLIHLCSVLLLLCCSFLGHKSVACLKMNYNSCISCHIYDVRKKIPIKSCPSCIGRSVM